MPVPTFTKTGTKATTPAKLDKAVFGLSVTNHELLKQAYLAYQANGRTNNAVTKTRGLIRGGGRKPWRQKGTGRARFGSSRNPLWRSGGVVFGPTGMENYSQSLNTKSKRQAIRQALSLAAEANKLMIIDDLKASGKTAEIAKLLDKLGTGYYTVLVVETKSPELIRATNNLPGVKLVSARYLSVFEILNADQLILTAPALSVVTDWLKTKEVKS